MELPWTISFTNKKQLSKKQYIVISNSASGNYEWSTGKHTHNSLFIRGPEEAILHWSGKFWTILNMCIKGSHRHTGCSYCAINMLMLGDLGACVPKNGCSEIKSGDISET